MNMDGSETGRTTAALLRRHPAWTAAAAALFAVLPFLPSLGYGFLVEWDDGGFVTHNPHLALSWENLHYNLTANLQGVYTPLTALWLMIDNAVFGGAPAGFHLVNLLLYGGCAAMLCLIMRELRIPPVAAVVLTLLWAWNPCKIETVGWIAERKGLASAFLAFCAMRLFLPACRRGRPSWSAALLTFAAFFFKPWVLPLPGVMAVYAWMLYPRDFRKLQNLLGPVAAAGILGAAIVSAVTFSELSGSQKPEAADYAGLLLRYAGAAFAPLSLNPLHPAAGFARMWPEALWGAAVLGCLWAAGFANFGPKRGLRLSLAFTVSLAGLALPVLSSGSFTNTNYADRYGFLLSALLWCWAGVAGSCWFRRFPRISTAAAALLAGGYLLAGYVYAETFSDARLLFARAAAEPDCPAKAIDGLALVGLNRNDPGLVYEAGTLFLARAALQPAPVRRSYEAAGALLTALAPAMAGGNPAAERKLASLLEHLDLPAVYSPTAFLARAWGIAAARLLQDGEKARALRMLECQLERGDGGSYELAFASGLYGYLTGDRERAVAGWKKALMLKPGDERARLNLKNAEAMHGSE